MVNLKDIKEKGHVCEYNIEKNKKIKNFWQRFIARLEKATGGKPPKCH